MAHRSKAAGGKPGNKTKRSSSNILVLIDTEHASTVGNTSTYIQCTPRMRAATPAAVTGGSRKERSLKKENNKNLNHTGPVGTMGRIRKRETFSPSCRTDPLVHPWLCWSWSHDKAGKRGNGYFHIASTCNEGVTCVL